MDANEQHDDSGVEAPQQPEWLAQISSFNSSNTERPEDVWSQMAPQQDDMPQEENIEAVLQELEQRYSSGFVPLEPNSLSSIAQAENNAPTASEENSEDVSSQGYEGPDATLSSALAELGRYSSSPDELQDNDQLQDTYFSDQSTPMNEPSWLAALRSSSVPQTPASSQEPISSTNEDEHFAQAEVQQDTSVEPFTAPMNASMEHDVPANDTEQTVGQASGSTEPFSFAPTKSPASPAAADSLSAARPNPLLENELETTMRRPAVRLQPVQQKSGFIQEPVRTSDAALGNDGNYREHLLNGYQAQLLGDFDAAMREYRLIIRNAPDLLGEVVSNMRALLKLAPNYSAGYRVLGDAYMRQGEYLQAMESYNKALTMVKKAKN
jgi:tetratricopeptide (TPR) repeat protein